MISRRLTGAFLLMFAAGAVACGLSVVGATDSSSDGGEADAALDRTGSTRSDGASTDDGDSAGGKDGSSSDAVADTTLSDASTEADAPASVIPCPELGDGGATLDGHCYFLLGPLAPSEAKTACEVAGAHLVTITSPAEQTLAGSVGAGDRWIGLTSPMPTNDPDDYVWITGEPVSVTFWGGGNPNDESPCVAMASNDLWSDRSCKNKYDAICERE